MSISKFTPILVAASIFAAPSVEATTFDFAAIADGDHTYGLTGGEQGATSFTFSKDGLSVTATGFSGISNDTYFAYLDSGSAGLGVCQDITTSTNQCSTPSDDNVTYGETLKLVFDQAVTIDTTTFVNGDHNTDFVGDFILSIDGGANTTYGLINIFDLDLTGTTFEFYNPNTGGGSNVSNNQQFYINTLDVTAVPVPAAVWLFGSGLIGLVGVARRKNV